MRRLFRILFAIAAAVLAVAVLYFAAAFALSSVVRQAIQPAPAHSAEAVEIYLISNGVHTDIAMPLRHPLWDWTVWTPPQHTRQQADYRYVAVGWGDRGFFLDTPTWADLTPATAAKALSGRAPSAMHATFYPQLQNGPNSIRIRISPQSYRRLAANISRSFDTAGGGTRRIGQAAYGGNDAFYEAHGHYSAFATCNTWTNRQLRDAGLKSVLWTPFQGALMEAYREEAAQ